MGLLLDAVAAASATDAPSLAGNCAPNVNAPWSFDGLLGYSRAHMSRSIVRSFSEPDERRAFTGGTLDLVTIGPLTFGFETLEPGWRWSQDVKPIAGTERCEFHHVGYEISGRWIAEDRDGTQHEIAPGQVYDIAPGHDAWVVGGEACRMIDFLGVSDWATRGSAGRVLTTVVFTDLVESTALIDRIGDVAWRRLQTQFFEDLRAVLSAHNGELVNTAGDGAMARFDSPGSAVRAAAALSLAAERLGLQSRTGIHTGEVEVAEKNSAGMTVHIAARLLGEARPGEILVTSATRDLTTDAGFAFEERGPVELKGVPGPRVLFAVQT
jgi:class 3 adenylate cyclase